MALYDRLSGHCNEAKGFVRHALAAATSARPQLMFDGVLLWSAMTKPLPQAVTSAGTRHANASAHILPFFSGPALKAPVAPAHPCMYIACKQRCARSQAAAAARPQTWLSTCGR